jgi:threonine dehydratase
MTMLTPLAPVTLDDVARARGRIASIALRTPLTRITTDDGNEIHLKLECLQPIGSFKLRGAANAMALAGPEALADGVYTASAGNMAQGVAWCARELGVRCQVVVPDHAPAAKTDAIARLGAGTIKVPFPEWWKALVDHGYPGIAGLFVHPFADPGVMAGNGTIALEILDDLPDVDVVLVPYGGGGLACGIASVMRAASPRTRVYAVETDTASPLTQALATGGPVPVTYTRTFVDGMGSGGVSEQMWDMAKSLLAGTVVVSLAQVAAAVHTLATRAHVVAEGAGAAALAAARSGAFDGQRVACIVSGGNIDPHRLAVILQGGIPE